MLFLGVSHKDTEAINTSCHKTYHYCISKSNFPLLLEPLQFLPVITVQDWARGETETLQVSKYQALVTSTVPTRNISLFCTCALLGPVDKHIYMHKHAQCECIFLYCTCAHVRVHKHPPVLAAHQRWAPVPPLCCQNVPVATLPLHSVQYCWCLDSFSWTYAAPLLHHIYLTCFRSLLKNSDLLVWQQ